MYKRLFTFVTILCFSALPFATAQSSLIISQWSAPSGFNVLTAADQYAYQDIALIFASLTKLDENLEPVPELASSWEVSEDGLTYTFQINPDAKWHDGEPVTAEDVAFTYQLVAHPDIPASYYSRLTSIKGFEAYHSGEAEIIEGLKVLDNLTIEFTLDAPNAAFLSNLSKSINGTNEILPKHLLGDTPPADILNSPFWNNPIGAGPYKFVQYEEGQFLELQAFDDYVLGAPKVGQLFVRIGTQDVLLAQLERGEVDFAQVPAPEFERTSTLPDINVTEISTPIFQAIYVNQLKPYLQDKRVRQAIVQAIDREALVQALLLGHGEVVRTPIAAPEWAVNMDVPAYPYDPERAQELLKEAGWDPNQTLVIRLGAGNKVREQSAPVIQQFLQAVGIKSEIQVTDFATLVQDMQEGTFDLALVGHTSGYDPDYTAIWSSTGAWPPNGNNFFRYSNPRVDELLELGRQETDPAARKPIYDEYQEIIVDEVAMVWLYRPTDILAVRDRVSGMQFGPGADPFWNIEDWTVSD